MATEKSIEALNESEELMENLTLNPKKERSLDEVLLESVNKLDLNALGQQFVEQNEFLLIENFLSQEEVDNLLIPQLDVSRPFVHRNYIPLQKKGGSISSFTIAQKAPIFSKLYKSPIMLELFKKLIGTGEPLHLCPDDDPHAVALYFYTEAGDHIGYHYDSSFYEGKRYTVLLGLIERSSCKLVCHVHTKSGGEKADIREISVTPGALIIFNGDNLYHCVTPLQEKEERVVLSMEYVTDQNMGLIGRVLSNVKDAFTYFGFSAIFGNYEGSESETLELEQVSSAGVTSSIQLDNENPATSFHNFTTSQSYPQIQHPSIKPNLIVFVNKLSGGQRGKEVLPLLRHYLGKENVFDLNKDNGPERGLILHAHTSNLRVIACGGDGTVRWVIQGMLKVGYEKLPPIGVLPLGTGNDLSRMFGWGPGYNGEDLSTIVPNMYRATTRPMDLWNCSITPWDPETGEIEEKLSHNQIMFNYFNIGFDPQVALGFHNLRMLYPNLFKARFINKCWYVWYALENMLLGSYPLDTACSLRIDENPVEIPRGVKTIVVLNFVCYQAGADIWGPDPDPDNIPKTDDGNVEVVGIYGALHETLIRLYLSPGVRLGRGKEIKLSITKPFQMPMAFDGEPILHKPAIVTVRSSGQIQVLQNPDEVEV